MDSPSNVLWRRLRIAADLIATLGMVTAVAWVWWNVAHQEARRPTGSQVTAPQTATTTGAPVVGSDDARVIAVEFSDFECPFCRQFSTTVLPEFKSRYIDRGLVQLGFRHLPLAAIHPNAMRAASLAVCATDQGLFWKMHDSLFGDPVELTRLDSRSIVKKVGLEPGRFATCLKDEANHRIQADLATARRLGIRATPSLVLGKRLKGRDFEVTKVITGSPTIDALAADVDALLNGRRSDPAAGPSGRRF